MLASEDLHKQVSNATCSWFDHLLELQSMYHNGISIPMALGVTTAYNCSPNWFVLKVKLIAQELFRVNRSHISNIH